MQLELLESRLLDEAARHRLRVSVAQVIRLANQLLALRAQKPTAAWSRMRRKWSSTALIDPLVEDWIERADARAIDLGVEREAVRMVGDPTLLQELIANLMDNALKYCDEGGKVSLLRVRGGIRCASGSSTTVRASPRSARTGLRALLPPRRHRASGGLGLSIAREIVRGHGGSITIDDGPDERGTRVRVMLPTDGHHGKTAGR